MKPDLKKYSLEQLRGLAVDIKGFDFDKRWGEGKLREALDSYFEKNPLDDKEPSPSGGPPPSEGTSPGAAVQSESAPKSADTPAESAPAVADAGPESVSAGGPPPPERAPALKAPAQAPPKATKSGKVRIQSEFRGVIGTSEGPVDFGDAGIAEVSQKVAEELASLNGYELCN
jgi:hypothetical protein